jgi:hypothetical protein
MKMFDEKTLQRQRRQVEKIMLKYPETIPTLRWMAGLLMLKKQTRRETDTAANRNAS